MVDLLVPAPTESRLLESAGLFFSRGVEVDPKACANGGVTHLLQTASRLDANRLTVS